MSSGGPHSLDLGFVPSLVQLVIIGLITWDWVRPIGEKRRTTSWESPGVWCGKLAPPKLWPLPLSVKDRWVSLREQVLNILITCWWYGPMKPCSLPSTGVWLKCTTSMIVLGEKLRWVPWATQSGWEVESRALFLESSASVQPYWWLTKGCSMRTT
jgi:hypothetical protein